MFIFIVCIKDILDARGIYVGRVLTRNRVLNPEVQKHKPKVTVREVIN